MVDLNCEGSATNKSYPSSLPCRHCLIHEFGDLDMPLAVAQLGHVQEHPQELQWTLSSPVELQWNLNRAPVRMELKFSSGTPGNPLYRASPARPILQNSRRGDRGGAEPTVSLKLTTKQLGIKNVQAGFAKLQCKLTRKPWSLANTEK